MYTVPMLYNTYVLQCTMITLLIFELSPQESLYFVNYVPVPYLRRKILCDFCQVAFVVLKLPLLYI